MDKNIGNIYGIASDETSRIEKERNDYKLLPLADWKMTERDCLEYCYSKGFYWEENGVRLYDILDRVSCWCCANKNKKELENMRIYLPEYYLRYIELLKKIKENNKKRSSSREGERTIYEIILDLQLKW